ncbi:hypothetical protein HN011_001943, partial [Eciton burchellii]
YDTDYRRERGTSWEKLRKLGHVEDCIDLRPRSRKLGRFRDYDPGRIDNHVTEDLEPGGIQAPQVAIDVIDDISASQSCDVNNIVRGEQKRKRTEADVRGSRIATETRRPEDALWTISGSDRRCYDSVAGTALARACARTRTRVSAAVGVARSSAIASFPGACKLAHDPSTVVNVPFDWSALRDRGERSIAETIDREIESNSSRPRETKVSSSF